MRKLRWLLALPLALAASVGTAGASSIRDHAGMFDPDTVRQAEAKLNEVERDSGLTTTIETIDSLQGEPLDEVTLRHAVRSNTEGLFILIPKKEHKLRVLASRPYRSALTDSRERAITSAFVNEFKQGNFDAGLKGGVDAVAREVSEAKAENGGVLRKAVPGPVRRGVPARGRAVPQGRPAFGLSSLLGIGLLIIAVLFGIRLLGALFGGNRGGYAGPGPGPGRMGPGYGGPGYGGGGGGGGFFSNMLGGLGGALAGNWLYDQFSGRHGGGTMDSSSYGPSQDATTGDAGGDWSGGGGADADWGGGGGDAGGGGDWGGGAGGDWGGGGGDGGGGGGDW